MTSPDAGLRPIDVAAGVAAAGGSADALPVAPPIGLTVNGRSHRLAVPRTAPLLLVLRNDLGLNGPKYGCGLGECGACLVLVDGTPARSCAVPVGCVEGRQITTLEGLADGDRRHPVQQAFIDCQAAQCGYCLNGMIVATVGLLLGNRAPTDRQVRDALSHNLCRCGAHLEILEAVQQAVLLTSGRSAECPPECPPTGSAECSPECPPTGSAECRSEGRGAPRSVLPGR